MDSTFRTRVSCFSLCKPSGYIMHFFFTLSGRIYVFQKFLFQNIFYPIFFFWRGGGHKFPNISVRKKFTAYLFVFFRTSLNAQLKTGFTLDTFFAYIQNDRTLISKYKLLQVFVQFFNPVTSPNFSLKFFKKLFLKDDREYQNYYTSFLISTKKLNNPVSNPLFEKKLWCIKKIIIKFAPSQIMLPSVDYGQKRSYFLYHIRK